METPKSHLHSASHAVPTDYGLEKESMSHADAEGVTETSSQPQQKNI